MSLETGVLYDNETSRVFYWHEPRGRSAGYLPDEHILWEAFWENRHVWGLAFAHTHPGSGLLWASETDRSTFKAVERGLGRTVDWVIVNENLATPFYAHGNVRYQHTEKPLMPERVLIELRLRSRASGLQLVNNLMREGLQ